MKPLTLTMEAFGSYGRQTVIDFETPDQNLFLITGDTGAGKTTIFDAIVFALYGEASSTSNKKDGMELQSQFAGLHVKPFVELTFSEGTGPDALIYKVRREPRHLRPLKKGVGLKEESETVSLTMPDGSEYPQKETDKKLEEIVGLTKGQFMQVAMIAQGEFMDLLRARSDDKKKIFRKLFKTELFQLITEELGRRKKEKEKEIATIRTVYQTEAAHVVIPEGYERRDQLQVLKDKIGTSDRLSAADMEAFLEELKLALDWLGQARDQKKQDWLDARNLRDEKREELTRAEGLVISYGQLEKAKEELEWCRQRENEITDIKIRITQLRDAYEIRDKHDQLEGALGRQTATVSALKEQETLLPGLKKEAATAAALEETAKEQFEQELEYFTQVSERVKKALEFFEKIEEAQEDVSCNQKKAEKAKTTAEKARGELSALEAREQDWRKQAEELGDINGRLQLWQVKNQEVNGLKTDLSELIRQNEETGIQKEQAKQARENYLSASLAYEQKHREYESRRKLFLDAQAGFLARELHPGRPCPVCGSLEHPSPCPQTKEHGYLSREALEVLAEKVNRLRTVQEQQAATAQSAQALADEKRESWDKAMERFCRLLARSIANVPEAVSLTQAGELVQELEKSVEEERTWLEEKSDILKRVQSSLIGVDQKKQKLREKAETAQREELNATAALSTSQAHLETLRNEAPKDFAAPEEARRVQKAAAEKKEEQNKAYKTAAEKTREAQAAKEQAETLIGRYRQELPVQEQETMRQKAAYETLLEQKQLSEPVWQSLTACYDRQEANRLQAIADEYHQRKAAAQGMEKTAKEAINDRKYPNLDTITQEKDEAERQYELAEGIWAQFKLHWQTDETILSALTPRMKERGRMVEEHTRLDTLYRLVSGNVTGARMDLETYVQRYYLEKILHSANRRFYDMSAGQFELRMCRLEKAGEGKNKGLDLMVYSTVTGKEREIRTLSGGESFMAALSLALGMADQIQESSAGINLDMMFIDEGFGSLDEHSRNQAVKVLQNMAGGSKLIGIISHVSELKQQIEDQLIVSKDDGGSRVRWQIS